MKRQEFAAFMRREFDEKIDALRQAGQDEYAGGENTFGNFERLAAQLGITREEVLLVYFAKHVDGIFAWARGHRSQREPVQGRIRDAIVYLFLLLGMAEDQDKEPRRGRPSPGLDKLALLANLANRVARLEETSAEEPDETKDPEPAAPLWIRCPLCEGAKELSGKACVRCGGEGEVVAPIGDEGCECEWHKMAAFYRLKSECPACGADR